MSREDIHKEIETKIEECVDSSSNSFVVSYGDGLDLDILKEAIESSFIFSDEFEEEGFSYDYFIDLSLPGFYTVYIIQLEPGVDIY